MYIKTKHLTIAAVCLALSMILILSESVLGISTLFLLGLAGFLMGIVLRECGWRLTLAYYFSSIVLSFILAPDKLKLPVFWGVETYLLFREGVWHYLEKDKKRNLKKLRYLYFGAKFIIFNLLFCPFMLFGSDIFFPRIEEKWKIIFLIAGQLVWYYLDRAYDSFQVVFWDGMKHKK